MALSDREHRDLLWALYEGHKMELAKIMNMALSEISQEFYDEMLEDLQVFAAK